MTNTNTAAVDLFALLAEVRTSPEAAAFVAQENADAARRAAGIVRLADGRDKHRCRRCSGSGRLDAYWYVQGGTCFGCNGSGSEIVAERGAL